MKQYEMNDGWVTQDLVAQVPPVSDDTSQQPAIEPSGSENPGVQSDVLARIPDLAEGASVAPSKRKTRRRRGDSRPLASDSAEETSVELSDRKSRWRRQDGRILGQGISTKLLIGGGVLMVAAAIVLPQLLGTPEQEGGKPPRPDAPPALDYDPTATVNSEPLQGEAYEPSMDLSADIPTIPPFLNTDSGSTEYVAPPPDRASVPHVSGLPRETSWDNRGVPARDASSASAPDWTPPAQPPLGTVQPTTSDARPPAVPSDSQRSPVTLDDRAVRPRETLHVLPQTATNQGMSLAQRPMISAEVQSMSHRTAMPADSQAGPQPGASNPAVQPAGPIARFDGTIERPSLRTTDGRTRPSIY